MIHTSPYFTPPKWARLRSPYFSSYFTPFYPFVCVFSHSCILTPNACWVVDCLKYLEVCRHFIIPREPGDQPSRLRLVVWKTSTQRRFSNVSLLLFHFIRRCCTLSKCHIDSEIQMWCIWDIYISVNLQKALILNFVIHLICTANKKWFMQPRSCLLLKICEYLPHITHIHHQYTKK